LSLRSLTGLGVRSDNIIHKLDIPPSEISDKTGFMSELFHYSIINKVKHLIDTLNENKNKHEYYISADLDIRYLMSNVQKWHDLQNFIDNDPHDVFFMRENTTDAVNGGFFIIKNQNIEKTIAFLTDIYAELITKTQAQLPMLEQQLINENLSKLSFNYIPNEYVIFGTTIYDKKSALFHHAVCCNDVDGKLKQISSIHQQLP
jgi:hypothetical protein